MKKFLMLLMLLASAVTVCTACDSLDSCGSDDPGSQVESVLKDMEISLSSKSFAYDGQEHSLEIEGELPEKAVVAWQNNALTDVGEQLVFATVRCAGYNQVSLKATLTVVGQDMSDAIALEEESVSVGYGEAYSFKIGDESLLPSGSVLTETYVDMNSGDVLESKPDFGGEFRYVLHIDAPGYNTKTVYGRLTIARPEATSVEITNLPEVPIAKYRGRPALLPNTEWVPEVNVYPKGHSAVELEFTTEDDSRIQFVNGAFVALENYGDCKITVSIKGTEISKTYNFVVPECSFYYEDFEDESKTLYVQQFVMEKNAQGQMDYTRDENGNYVFIEIPRGQEVRLDANGKAERDADGNVLFFDKAVPDANYGAYAAGASSSEVVTQNGNKVMQIGITENFTNNYSFLEIDACPSGGWEVGTYSLEMDVAQVTGEYPFTFYWVNPTATASGGVELLLGSNGVTADMRAIVEDGKLSIEFSLTAANLAEGNAIRFAAFAKNAFEFTVDNIRIIKIS